MGDEADKLDDLRERIDDLDRRIVTLLNERAGVVVDVGRAKRAGGAATYVPDREHDVLDRVRALNQGPLPQQTVTAIYRELMSGSLALERPPRIAYLGPAGSFSHLAAMRKFGATVEYEALGHIAACFDEIERDRVDLALVPVENSLGGGIVDTLDAFVTRRVSVCGEINLAVHQHLLANGLLESIEKVYSKPEAFAQCQRWLTETGFWDKTHPVSSTSKAAELASGERNAAAIGSKLAGDIFGLNVLTDRIEDDPNNVTRFVIIARQPAGRTGDDKTAVYFRAADRPGALAEALDTFHKAGINMTFIQSRPGRQERFDYAFFVDVVGHVDDPAVSGAIEECRAHCTDFRVLGSFPRAREVL